VILINLIFFAFYIGLIGTICWEIKVKITHKIDNILVKNNSSSFTDFVLVINLVQLFLGSALMVVLQLTRIQIYPGQDLSLLAFYGLAIKLSLVRRCFPIKELAGILPLLVIIPWLFNGDSGSVLEASNLFLQYILFYLPLPLLSSLLLLLTSVISLFSLHVLLTASLISFPLLGWRSKRMLLFRLFSAFALVYHFHLKYPLKMDPKEKYLRPHQEDSSSMSNVSSLIASPLPSSDDLVNLSLGGQGHSPSSFLSMGTIQAGPPINSSQCDSLILLTSLNSILPGNNFTKTRGDFDNLTSTGNQVIEKSTNMTTCDDIISMCETNTRSEKIQNEKPSGNFTPHNRFNTLNDLKANLKTIFVGEPNLLDMQPIQVGGFFPAHQHKKFNQSNQCENTRLTFLSMGFDTKLVNMDESLTDVTKIHKIEITKSKSDTVFVDVDELEGGAKINSMETTSKKINYEHLNEKANDMLLEENLKDEIDCFSENDPEEAFLVLDADADQEGSCTVDILDISQKNSFVKNFLQLNIFFHSLFPNLPNFLSTFRVKKVTLLGFSHLCLHLPGSKVSLVNLGIYKEEKRKGASNTGKDWIANHHETFFFRVKQSVSYFVDMFVSSIF